MSKTILTVNARRIIRYNRHGKEDCCGHTEKIIRDITITFYDARDSVDLKNLNETEFRIVLEKLGIKNPNY